MASVSSTIALADPCTAHLPAPGRAFSGPVVYVGDGDSLCVAAVKGRELDPATWVEVRLADFYAPELAEPGGESAKRGLSRLALDRQVVCRAGARSYDRVVAVCRRDGRALGDLMRAAGQTEGGNGWKPR